MWKNGISVKNNGISVKKNQQVNGPGLYKSSQVCNKCAIQLLVTLFVITCYCLDTQQAWSNATKCSQEKMTFADVLYSPYLCDSFALCLVLNGAVVIELYVIKFASTSNMCFYQILFTQNYILFYSPNLCNSNAHGFVLNGAVSIELYTIYYVSISEPSGKQHTS